MIPHCRIRSHWPRAQIAGQRRSSRQNPGQQLRRVEIFRLRNLDEFQDIDPPLAEFD